MGGFFLNFPEKKMFPFALELLASQGREYITLKRYY